MKSMISYLLALAGLSGVLTIFADETPLEIKTDLEGDYFIVSKGGTANKPMLLVKRVSSDFTYYIKREFDCEARTVRYLGEGESLEAVAVSEPEPELSAIRGGSVSDQLARLICPKQEPAEEQGPGKD